ncbi:alpha/beta fold hydrolase [Bradyrhizobium sp. HKCCYLS1011]|uniref:alpha/beta fold hydrolase n=1 Tax=Bradyrhizobium sp. HKCCYLS1011 TaxID=3420733 RepID=UPI003EBFB874
MELNSVTFADGRLTAVQTGAGADLLIVHSLLADRAAFDPVLPWLARRFRVTLVNLPGFHGSACIAPGIEGYADRLASVFVTGGLSKETIVIGNGFGGTTAISMALRHGDKFGKLVLTDVAAGFPPEGRKAFEVMAAKVEHEGIGSVATISAKRVFHDAYLAAHPGAVEERRRVLLGIAPEGFIAACRSLMSADLTPQLGSIRKPTRVVCGELDAATPPPLCRLLADKIPGATYVELPGCGHCPPLEQPDAFIRAVEDFLA